MKYEKNVNMYTILYNASQKCAGIAEFLKSLLRLLQCFSHNFLSQHDFSLI